MNPRYGSKTIVTLDAAGNGTIVETTYRARAVASVVTYRESVLIEDEPQLLAEMLKHLEFCKQPGRLDPVFELHTDRETGAIKRLVKGWTEIG